MSEMVERVARALWKQHNGLALRVDEGAPDWAKEEARTAIAAMREPTDRMTVHSIEVEKLFHGQARCGNLIWQAMIDEALK